MINWYVTKIKFTKEFPDGTLKRITEAHLVGAVSFSDAEARIYEEVGEFIRGEFIVTCIERANYSDIFEYDGDTSWWMVKVAYDVEEETGGTTKIVNTCLVSAPDAKHAIERVEDRFKETISQFTIPELKLTKLIEIHPPVSDEERDQRKLEKLKADSEMLD